METKQIPPKYPFWSILIKQKTKIPTQREKEDKLTIQLNITQEELFLIVSDSRFLHFHSTLLRCKVFNIVVSYIHLNIFNHTSVSAGPVTFLFSYLMIEHPHKYNTIEPNYKNGSKRF